MLGFSTAVGLTNAIRTGRVAKHADGGHVLEGVRAPRHVLGHSDAGVEQEQRQANAVTDERGDKGEGAREPGPRASVRRTEHDAHAPLVVGRMRRPERG